MSESVPRSKLRGAALGYLQNNQCWQVSSQISHYQVLNKRFSKFRRDCADKESHATIGGRVNCHCQQMTEGRSSAPESANYWTLNSSCYDATISDISPLQLRLSVYGSLS